MEKNRKIALLQDVVCRTGGAEMVLEIFLEMFPACDLYTLFIVSDRRNLIKKKFPKVKIHTSIFQNLIKNNYVPKYISVIKIFSWIYWKFLNLKSYNLIISSSHSFGAKNTKKYKTCPHISYIHTPPRYLYDEFCEIGFIRKFPFVLLFQPIKLVLKWIDRNGSLSPNMLIANSKNVQKRIKKYYNKDSIVLYPPVKMLGYNTKKKRQDYFICLSRLVKQKGTDLAVRVCTKYNIPLIIVGDGSEFNNLKKIAGRKVRFERHCSDSKKADLLAKAKALIYLSIEEDFGIVPIEAMSVGTPVIAFNSGGVTETVVHKKTGLLFDDYNEDGLKKTMDLLDKIKINPNECVKQAKKFQINTFKNNFFKLIESF